MQPNAMMPMARPMMGQMGQMGQPGMNPQDILRLIMMQNMRQAPPSPLGAPRFGYTPPPQAGPMALGAMGNIGRGMQGMGQGMMPAPPPQQQNRGAQVDPELLRQLVLALQQAAAARGQPGQPMQP